MNTNTVKKEETKAIVVKEAQVIEYVDKANADRENRIVGEIKLITEQTKQVVLMGSIEIGRRLTEAKALVKHGQWGAWLKDRIDYSQRTANNFMRIYKEYGETGLAEKSQSIANLSYTHALALLDVPAEERAKFAEEKNAQDMKIKELQEAIKTLKAARSTDAERYKKELAEKDAAFLKAKSETKQRMEEIQKLEAKAKQAEANKQAEVKKQLDIAIAKEREELKRANDTVDSMQSEIKELTKKQQDEKGWIDAGAHKAQIVRCEITEKETAPPKPYTEGTLITDMASIAKYVSDPEIKAVLKQKDDGKKGEHGGIGTTATRSEIIEKLKARGFIAEEKGKLRSTEKGRVFYHLLPADIRGADTTAKWWILQQDVADGTANVNAILESVVEVFRSHQDTAYIGASIPGKSRTVVGKCPLCGKDVVQSGSVYTCSSNKNEKQNDGSWKQVDGCGFKLFGFCNKKFTVKQAENLLVGKPVVLRGCKSKAGKTFDCKVKLTHEGNVEPEFGGKGRRRK